MQESVIKDIASRIKSITYRRKSDLIAGDKRVKRTNSGVYMALSSGKEILTQSIP